MFRFLPLVALFSLFVAVSFADSAADEGWRVLEDGGFGESYLKFQSVIATDAKNPSANFGLAVSGFFSLLSDPAVISNLSASGWTDYPGDASWISGFTRKPSLPAIPSSDSNIRPISNWQDLAETKFQPWIAVALLALEAAETNSKFSVTLDMTKIGKVIGQTAGDVPNLKRADAAAVYLFDAALSASAAALKILAAHDLDCDLPALSAMFSGGKFRSDKCYNPFADARYPGFGTLRAGSKAKFAAAKKLLKRAAEKTLRALALIEADKSNRSDCIIPTLSSADLRSYRSIPTRLISSLAGNYEDFGIDMGVQGIPTMSVGRFLDAGLSLRALFCELGPNGEPAIYDILQMSRTDSPIEGLPYLVRLLSPDFGGLFSESLAISEGLTPLIASYRSDLTPLGNILQALIPVPDYTYDPDAPSSKSGGRKKDN